MRLINADDVLSIVDDLRDQMTVEGYCAMVERIKALPSAQPVDKDIDDPVKDCISRQMLLEYIHGEPVGKLLCDKYNLDGLIEQFPSAQPELIEQGAYVRGFEQGRTQGMIDNTIKAEWTNADALDLQPTCNQLATDYISRQEAIRVASGYCHPANIANELEKLPSVQPEIIYCKDCVKHNKGHGYYLDGTFIGIKDCCPLVEIRGIAQGHEFDYQYCAYAERRTDGRSDKQTSGD